MAEKDCGEREVTKHGTIRYVMYGFQLVCYSNFFPKRLRRANFQKFDFNNVVTLKSGSEVTQGHWNRHIHNNNHNHRISIAPITRRTWVHYKYIGNIQLSNVKHRIKIVSDTHRSATYEVILKFRSNQGPT